MNNKRNTIATFIKNKRNAIVKFIVSSILIIAFLATVYILEQIIPVSSKWAMLLMVLKKGAIYSLVAVSMNLLNGFTGLFSLGQAGFMLIGAYTYGVLTIPAAADCLYISIMTAALFSLQFLLCLPWF